MNATEKETSTVSPKYSVCGENRWRRPSATRARMTAMGHEDKKMGLSAVLWKPKRNSEKALKRFTALGGNSSGSWNPISPRKSTYHTHGAKDASTRTAEMPKRCRLCGGESCLRRKKKNACASRLRKKKKSAKTPRNAERAKSA